MIRIDCIWLALGASDLRRGIDKWLAQVVHGFALGALGAQAHHAYVFANRRADRLKLLVFDGRGMWLCTRRLQVGSFAWPREDWPMLESALTTTCDTPAPAAAVPEAVPQTLQGLRDLLERLHAELKFQKARNEALSFLIARLKRWRFGSSSVWVYRTTNFMPQRAVLFDFCTSRGGEHPQRVLQDFTGTLVTDDHSGYHKLQRAGAITGSLCMAYARRKLFEAHKLNGSQIAAHAVALIAKLHEVERDARELDPPARLLLRPSRAKPIADALHAWLLEKRQTLAKADTTAEAINCSLSNRRALKHDLDDGHVPIDNNAVENSIWPLSVGRKKWLFVGSQQAGERAAVMLSLIESAKLNGHDPRAYLKDVFKRLPTPKNRDLESLLPHNWQPADKAPAPTVPAAACAVTANPEPSAAG